MPNSSDSRAKSTQGPAGEEDSADGTDAIGADGAPDDDRLRRVTAGWAGWAISASFHLLLILLMASIYFLVSTPEIDVPPVRVTTIEPPPKPVEKPKERALQAEVQLDIEAESDHPNPISQLDLPVEDSEREEESDSPVAKGREEAVADSEMGGSGAFMAIGSGGGSAGMFGSRSGGGRKRAVGRFGGSKGSESAVDAALRWLKRHQDPNGMWNAVSYPNNCTDGGGRCEPGSNAYDEESTSVALTGYALLCFLGAGFDHQTPNKYKATVTKGLAWLLAAQHPDGRFGIRNYENAVASMAIAEVYAMTGDPSLKQPAQRGVDVILATQCLDSAPGGAPAAGSSASSGRLGWDYITSTTRNDSSVTGWNVMALKSALAAGLNVGAGMDGAKRWLERVWQNANPQWRSLDAYTGRAIMPYAYWDDSHRMTFLDHGNAEVDKHVGVNLSCVGMVCAVFLGHHAGDPMLESFANEAIASIPAAYPFNTYYVYYNTLGMFQVGGERWKRWNGSVRDVLVNAQRKEASCFDGSWDWKDTRFYGSDIGRVLSTVYNCLSLEVYYRYAQVAVKK
ncbi:MAG: terpene cyclase/mutase family protein [Planctomycetes bacterium]|nr:terpene cyclase/mutase family protein [Planctomycetota bacterium]